MDQQDGVFYNQRNFRSTFDVSVMDCVGNKCSCNFTLIQLDTFHTNFCNNAFKMWHTATCWRRNLCSGCQFITIRGHTRNRNL